MVMLSSVSSCIDLVVVEVHDKAKGASGNSVLDSSLNTNVKGS